MKLNGLRKKNLLIVMMNIIISLLFVFVIYIASTNFNNQNLTLSVDDGIRHIKYVEILDKYGIQETYEKYSWGKLIPNSILADYDADIWKGHHLLLLLLKKIGFEDINLLKIYYSIFVGIMVFLILSLGAKLKLPMFFSIVVLFFFLGNDFLLHRMFLARPFIFSVFLFVLLLLVLVYRKEKLIALIFLIATFYHGLFWLLFLPILIYIIYFRLKITQIAKVFLFCFIGIIGGLIIHGNAVDYIILSFLTIFYVPLLHMFNRSFASELTGQLSWVVFNIGTILFSGLLIFYFSFGYANIKGKIFSFDPKLNFLLINSLIFFIGGIFVSRVFDYGLVIIYISMLFLINGLYNLKALEGIQKLFKNYILISMLIICYIFVFGNVLIYYQDRGYDLEKKIKFIEDNKSLIPEGSNITSYSFLDFPFVFYAFGENYKYNAVMEPYYFYLKDEKTFRKYVETVYTYIFVPNEISDLDLYDGFQLYDNDYLISFGVKDVYSYHLYKLFKIDLDLITKDPRFKIIVEDGDNYIWKLK